MIRAALLLGVSLGLLAACGLQGDLERPVPMWGNPPNEGPNDPRTLKAEEERQAAEEAQRDAEREAAREARQPVEPVPTAPQR